MDTAEIDMSNLGPVGFLSYVHKDNERTKGRVLGLIRDIVDEFSLLTGEDLELFVDRTSLEWGDRWRAKINGALQDTTFFIPVVTPSYFKSQECRNELLKFATAAHAVDAGELLLPILYIEVEGLREDSSDEAMALIAQTQYVDWTELRLTETTSAGYLRKINECAKRLAAVNSSYSARAAVLPNGEPQAHILSDADDDWDTDAPGLMDHVAQVEQDMPEWSRLMEEWAAPTQLIGELAERASKRIEKGVAEGKTTGHKILVAQELAADLRDPTKQLERLGQEYMTVTLKMDGGVRAILSFASEQTDQNERKAACEMFDVVRGFIQSARTASESVRGLIESMEGPAKSFKDLRRPLAVMRRGLRSFLDAQAIYDEWERMIATSPLNCGEVLIDNK